VARRTLVIGGTRNVGPDLVAALLLRGDEVTVLSRGISPCAPPAAALRLFADRSDKAALAAALKGRSFDLVVDTTLMNGADARGAAEVLGGRAGRYVWWSTGQVYLVRVGPVRPFREEDYAGELMSEPPAGEAEDRRNWTYGVEKRAAEDAMLEAHQDTGFPCVALRLPMVNSERDHYGRIAAYAHRLLDGGPIVAPEDEPPLRHVYGRDVVSATLLAAARAEPGATLNVGQDETLSLEEMLDLIAAACGRPYRLVRAPRRALDGLGLLPGCSPFSDAWMSSLDNARSKAALGITYTSPRDYVPRVVEAALKLPAASVRGYDRRPEELALTFCG
jgi:nucleoside-diphosphate-sugar epimerase